MPGSKKKKGILEGIFSLSPFGKAAKAIEGGVKRSKQRPAPRRLKSRTVNPDEEAVLKRQQEFLRNKRKRDRAKSTR
jgi:hypothetical protein